MKSLLFILISFIAVTATSSGIILISNPDGRILDLPLSLLDDTPFKNFLIPGILLTLLVGGINILAVFYYLKQHPTRYNWAIAGGIMTTGWIIGQMILIHAVHWLHVLYLGIGILIILLAYQLKGKWVV
ncbi:MAG: hypothetical protein Q8891_04665 [Bacteroidota bacterium]|nr:hypothetical protein [Bacteroidota bacterium]